MNSAGEAGVLDLNRRRKRETVDRPPHQRPKHLSRGDKKKHLRGNSGEGNRWIAFSFPERFLFFSVFLIFLTSLIFVGYVISNF
jgi:hypothetical protein